MRTADDPAQNIGIFGGSRSHRLRHRLAVRRACVFAHDLRHRYYQPHVLIGAEGTSAVVAILLILGACGPNAAAPAGTPPAPGASAAAAPSAPASSTNQTAGMGYLEGRASIGPLQPVERVGVPTPA